MDDIVVQQVARWFAQVGFDENYVGKDCVAVSTVRNRVAEQLLSRSYQTALKPLSASTRQSLNAVIPVTAAFQTHLVERCTELFCEKLDILLQDIRAR
ncbi:hypothetical protein [Allostella humosa]|uniref:hypothetical protein n=1 Tax=Stella humosa TaxID=94 RepID=UPI00114F5364|nr:hypothetical protein [Stella humosa]